ncbi:MAG: 3'-5' exonuclease, partial [Candidatus Krumholzibacteria bacterium]|nr:3'-5' exonuclease [Candidatus Krumholzibacteria bacterium]
QKWARGESAGEVLLLEPFAAAEADESDPDAPIDERSGDQLAAQATAQLVRRMKEDAAHGTWEGFGDKLVARPLRWDDFLILSRTRTEISLYEKAFRDADIPFVPPGRGMLAASREVQDILSLLRWLLWPDDDAALASVLRSPIFRLEDQSFQELLGARDLFKPSDVADRYRTPSNLWPTLKKKADQEPFARPVRLLKEWRKHLGFDTCHDLLRRIYREGEVLERYQIARGDQARYNLLRLYDLALSPEIAGTPTVRQLADFIGVAASRGGQEEGALPRDGGEGRVQFMTVHGAKGLEAPVVFLVDANRPAGKESPRVRVRPESPDTPLLFKVVKAYRDGFKVPDGVIWPQDQLQTVSAQARERDLTEEANLLYVAMTRARDRLVLVGSQRETGEENDSPMRKIATGILADGCAEHFQTDDPAGMMRPPEPVAPKAAAVPTHVADDTQAWQPPPPRETMKVITPSGVHDENADDNVPLSAGPRVQQDETDPTERGHQVHLMLQLAADHGAMPAGDTAYHAEAETVFADSSLDWVFRPQSEGGQGLSEVPVIHRRPSNGPDATEERITGIIDRLVVRADRVDIVDYKTNRFGGDAAVRANLVEHYRPQLATYGEVVAELYPDHDIHTWLLFTEPGLPNDQRLEEVTVS